MLLQAIPASGPVGLLITVAMLLHPIRAPVQPRLARQQPSMDGRQGEEDRIFTLALWYRKEDLPDVATNGYPVDHERL
jgi:hypothetical protein